MKLKMDNIKVSIQNNHIINGISIDVESKEFVGIIGPNGSGKSTFLKCIYRALKPSAGGVYIDDKDISNLSIKESAKKIAVVSQHNNYNFDFNVEDIVLMGREPHKSLIQANTKLDYEIMYESLKKVGLEKFAKRSFNSLSGGERQRVILARALTQQTQCIILDEPTNHLDIKYKLQLMSIVKKLDIQIIAAIHDLNIAAMFCDKIYALKDGKIIDYGEPKEIITSKLIKKLYNVESTIIKFEDTINVIYKPFL